ncbi:DUF3857 domain-containing protein [Plebeiibacterium marinum]|uniref:DUF3857 domain-containing protein n=1 Tax=Plebeiibacterium marinum TaxID=2992111 RepID=A0AAE3SJC6_9BACT|nr:DUF3857 domain-containing protein [Plebeiobacterium marinum]MCW3805610.1 DUF3857 domain-containing protein [Plebeiobacterium marinum]
MYPVSSIPKELLTGADAVVREKNTVVEVVSLSKVVYHEKYVVTILKESGKDKALFEEAYDKLSSITDISATVYDAEGKKVKSIPLSEIRDFSAVSGNSLYEDNRVKVIDPKYNTYPYTVAYSFQHKFNSTFYLRGWSAFNGYNTSVERLSYKITAPEVFKYRYEEFNVETQAKEVVNDGIKEVSWEIKGFEAPQEEVLAGKFEGWIPTVHMAPAKFIIDNYKGSFESWNDYGQYVGRLNQGKDNIPVETVDEVRQMFKEGMSDYDKIAIAYQYSQQKNRYVSIKEGIGGWQPFDAETVDRLSYGDCKALSNYVTSLLCKLGYDAHYCLIYAGNHQRTKTEFVENSFNHIVSCVILESDTLWLECTNSHYPCGYMGSSTDDRYALVIKDTGGELLKTPSYTVNDNNINTRAHVKINVKEASELEMHQIFRGALFPESFALTILDETDRRKAVINSVNLPHFDLLDYNVTAYKERKPWVEKEVKLSIPAFGSIMGDRMFFSLNSLNKSSSLPPYSRNRKSPMLLSRPYSENDTINYIMPEGYKMEALPKPVELKSEFGLYACSAVAEGRNIVYKREFKIYKGEYPKEKYNDFVEFLESVAKYDEAKAVLVKNI